ncbi:MAG: transporter substrate-binding domain-containing protein [Synergistaceae bacterium]|nr:transporter substrate-binding domain-containing protein [Synergistaceae bacterium]
MKNFLLVAVMLFCITVYAGVRYDTKGDRVLRVGTECDYAPNNWEEHRETDSNVPLANKEGYYAEGYDIQVAKIVAKSIGAKLEVRKIAWEDLIPALNRREIDAIFSGMLDTSERKQSIAFTDTYEDRVTEYAILVQKYGRWANAKKLTDFEGARFVGQEGTNLDDAIDQLPGAIHLPPVDTAAKMIEALNRGKADGIITDFEIMSSYVKTYPHLKAIRLPKNETFVFDYTGVCAGVRKTDVKLTKEINSALKNISQHERKRLMDRSVAREWENI